MEAKKEKINYNDLFDIPGFEGIYSITKDGRVWNYSKNRWKPSNPRSNIHKHYSKVKYCVGIDAKDFLSVTLHNSGVSKTHSIHTLLARMFLKNPYGYKYVHHKDFNRTNNKIENLVWVERPIIKRKKLFVGIIK